MCRMLIAAGEIDVNTILQGAILMAKDKNNLHELNKEKGLGSWTHGDGWGIAYLDEKDRWQLKKSTKAIYNDPAAKELKNMNTNILTLHMRKASVGRISYENTHPFTAFEKNLGTVIFCHNGSIKEEISFDPEYKPAGETDSEKLFYSLLTDFKKMSKTAQKNAMEKAIQKNLKTYKKLSGTNIILSTKEKTIVAVGKNKFPLYFKMWLGAGEEKTSSGKTDSKSVIISSEKMKNLPNFSWKLLQRGDIVSLTHKTLGISFFKD
ncbi:MAG: class II glutamine amidotransferase [Nanoarchaeota archaeon]